MPSEVDGDIVEQRIVEAAPLLSGWGGVTGWAALRWLGGSWFEGRGPGGREQLPVPLAVGLNHPVRPQPGVQISNEGVPPHHQRRVDGVRVTTAVRSVAYEMRFANTLRDACQTFAVAAYDDLVSISELAAFTERELVAKTGVGMVRRALPHLTENAWSPMEPVMYDVWVNAGGHPAPRYNVPVFDRAGRFVATPDLVDLENGVYGQYDGGLHLLGEVRQRDVEAEAGLRALGLEPAVMMIGDLSDCGPFLVRLDQAYARAARRPASQRLWTDQPPAWWTPTLTVDQRRALTGSDRARLLRYRHRLAA